MAVAFCIPYTTVCLIIKDTLSAIWKALQPVYLPQPTTAMFEQICSDYWNMWNFPNCCGALDGKHVMVQKPKGGGSLYRNYKDRDSVVLMAMCDARYRFTFVDIGQYGGRSDGGVFASTALSSAMEKDPNLFPPSKPLPGEQHLVPHFLLADDAFPLKTWLLKPYPGSGLTEAQKIYNYRLSRARRCIENAFGIMAARWRIFRRPIEASLSTVDGIIKSACCLHNFLMSQPDCRQYCPPRFVDSDSHGECHIGDYHSITVADDGLLNLNLPRGRMPKGDAVSVRQHLTNYLCQPPGSDWCPWQFDYVRRGRIE